MKAAWLGTLKGEERENFKTAVLNSQFVLDKLREIVYNMYNEDSRPSKADYDNPSWSHRQAHTNGRLEVAREILGLLTFDNKEAHTNG